MPPGEMSQDEMQEKLKNMSPEELKEFQKQQCIFCHIISGKVQSKKVYEDKQVLAILDINPANPGHILLLPKEHYAILPQLPEEEIGYIFQVAKALSHALLKALKCQGTNIFVANGVAAGQKAQHFMVHVIPRMENDKVPMEIHEGAMSEDQLSQVQRLLLEKLGKKPHTPHVVEATYREEKMQPKERKQELRDETKTEVKTKADEPKKMIKEAEKDVLDILGGKEKRDEKNRAKKPKKAVKTVIKAEKRTEKKGPDLDDISRLFGA